MPTVPINWFMNRILTSNTLFSGSCSFSYYSLYTCTSNTIQHHLFLKVHRRHTHWLAEEKSSIWLRSGFSSIWLVNVYLTNSESAVVTRPWSPTTTPSCEKNTLKVLESKMYCVVDRQLYCINKHVCNFADKWHLIYLANLMDIALPDNRLIRCITIPKCLNIITTSAKQWDKVLDRYTNQGWGQLFEMHAIAIVCSCEASVCSCNRSCSCDCLKPSFAVVLAVVPSYDPSFAVVIAVVPGWNP